MNDIMIQFLFPKGKIPWIFISISLSFFAFAIIIENINERFWLNDFQVYYSASKSFISGETPYNVAFGLSSGFYKYSPFTLLIFSPYSLFSFEIAKIIHFIVISLATIASILGLYKILNVDIFKKFSIKPRTFLFLIFIISIIHLTRELHLGNINMIMILLVLICLSSTIEKKFWISGIGLSIIFLLKPYFLILILPLLIFRQWKLLLITSCSIIILLITPAFIVGIEGLSQLHVDWIQTMSGHTQSGFSEHTFISIIHSYTNISLENKWHYLLILITGVIYLIGRSNYFISKSKLTNNVFILDSFILLALIPNLVITDSQHFLYSLPLIGYLLVLIQQKQSFWMIPLFIILLFFYGANSNDLLGNPLSDKFDEYSTIGMANVGLVVFTIILNSRNTLFSPGRNAHEKH